MKKTTPGAQLNLLRKVGKITCAFCGEEKTLRLTAKYCCVLCRVKAYQQRKRENQSAVSSSNPPRQSSR